MGDGSQSPGAFPITRNRTRHLGRGLGGTAGAGGSGGGEQITWIPPPLTVLPCPH